MSNSNAALVASILIGSKEDSFTDINAAVNSAVRTAISSDGLSLAANVLNLANLDYCFSKCSFNCNTCNASLLTTLNAGGLSIQAAIIVSDSLISEKQTAFANEPATLAIAVAGALTSNGLGNATNIIALASRDTCFSQCTNTCGKCNSSLIGTLVSSGVPNGTSAVLAATLVNAKQTAFLDSIEAIKAAATSTLELVRLENATHTFVVANLDPCFSKCTTSCTSCTATLTNTYVQSGVDNVTSLRLATLLIASKESAFANSLINTRTATIVAISESSLTSASNDLSLAALDPCFSKCTVACSSCKASLSNTLSDGGLDNQTATALALTLIAAMKSAFSNENTAVLTAITSNLAVSDLSNAADVCGTCSYGTSSPDLNGSQAFVEKWRTTQPDPMMPPLVTPVNPALFPSPEACSLNPSAVLYSSHVCGAIKDDSLGPYAPCLPLLPSAKVNALYQSCMIDSCSFSSVARLCDSYAMLDKFCSDAGISVRSVRDSCGVCFGDDSTCTIPSRGLATVSGYGVIKTFDGDVVQFGGSEEYTLAKCSAPQYDFVMDGAFGSCKVGATNGCLQAFSLEIPGFGLLILNTSGDITFDGLVVTSPLSFGPVALTSINGYIQVSAYDDALELSFNPSLQTLDVSVSKELKNLVTGLFGNFDGLATNDRILGNNQSFIASNDWDFGKSWTVPLDQRTMNFVNGTDPATPPTPSCTIPQNEATAKCDVLSNPSSPYSNCFLALPPAPYLAACINSYCACGGSCLAGVLSTYETTCATMGMTQIGSMFDVCGIAFGDGSTCKSNFGTGSAFGLASYMSIDGALLEIQSEAQLLFTSDVFESDFAINIRTRPNSFDALATLGIRSTGAWDLHLYMSGNYELSDGTSNIFPRTFKDGSQITKTLDGTVVVLIRPSGVVLRLNTITKTIFAMVPKTYSNRTMGLLGNFNGDPSDDYLGEYLAEPPAQLIVPVSPDTFIDPVATMLFPDPSMMIGTCPSNPGGAEAAQVLCNHLNSTTGPFANCLHLQGAAQFYQMCWREVCKFPVETWQTQCPATITAFAQTCALRSTVGNITDKCGACLGDGSSCEVAKKLSSNLTCVAFGDPHYLTFSGQYYSFQGHCEYVFARGGRGCSGDDFEIRVFNSEVRPSTTRAVLITLPGSNQTIELHRNGKSLVNNKNVAFLPYLSPDLFTMELIRDGAAVRITLTQFGVSLLWDGKALVRLTVPSLYQDNICGLCNDFDVNADQTHFYLADGTSVTDTEVFAGSWLIPMVDSLGVPCSDAGPVFSRRRGAAQEQDPLVLYPTRVNMSLSFCKQLTDPFGRYMNCIPFVDPTPYHSGCTYDVASCNSEQCGGMAYKAYEFACRDVPTTFITIFDSCGMIGGNGSTCQISSIPINIGDLNDAQRNLALNSWVNNGVDFGNSFIASGGFALFFNHTAVTSNSMSQTFLHSNVLIEFWVKPVRVGGVILSYLAMPPSVGQSFQPQTCEPKDESETFSDPFTPEITNGSPEGATFSIFDDGTLKLSYGDELPVDTGLSMAIGNWTHVSFTYSNITGAVQMYAFDPSGAYTFGNFHLPPGISRAGGTLSLGAWQPGRIGSNPTASTFEGFIDEVHIYEKDSGFDKSFIEKNYNRDVQQSDDYLINLWKFDDGAGSTAYDTAATSISNPANLYLTEKPWPAAGWALSDAPLLRSSATTTSVQIGSGSAALEEASMALCNMFMHGDNVCRLLGPATSQFYFMSCLNDIAISSNLANGMASTVAYADKCQSLLNLPDWPLQPYCNAYSQFPNVHVPGYIGVNCSVRCVFGIASTNNTEVCECQPGFFGSSCEQVCPGGSSNPCYGNGRCSTEGLCFCNSNWQGNTRCSACTSGWVGTDCSFAVTPATNSSFVSALISGPGQITTFDGLSFVFTGFGSFYLMKSDDGRVEVKARLIPCVGASNFACVSGITIIADSSKIDFQAPSIPGNPMVILNVSSAISFNAPMPMGSPDLLLTLRANTAASYVLVSEAIGDMLTVSLEGVSLRVEMRLSREVPPIPTPTSITTVTADNSTNSSIPTLTAENSTNSTIFPPVTSILVPRPWSVETCFNITGLFGTCDSTRSFLSGNMSQTLLSAQLSVSNKPPNITNQAFSGAGYSLKFDNSKAVSMPLQVGDYEDVSLEFLVKSCSHGGVIMSVATENITFALSNGDTRMFTQLYPHPDGSSFLYMQSLFRPLIGSTITLSNLGSVLWRPVSYTPHSKLTLLKLVSNVAFNSLVINATTGTWSSSTLHVHYGQHTYDTGIELQIEQWNQITVVWSGTEVQLFVFYSNATYFTKVMALGNSVFVDGALIGLGTWLTSLTAGVPPGVAFCGQMDEFRMWNRRTNLFVVQQGLNLNIVAGTPGLLSLWKFNEGVGSIASDDIAGNAFIFAALNPPEWTVSDDFAVPLTPSLSSPLKAPPKTSVITATMKLYRRDVHYFGTVWPTNINPMSFTADQQERTLLKCTTWMSALLGANLCGSLYPTPAQFYWLSCLRETVLNADIMFGLRSIFSFAKYCQSSLSTAVRPGQTLCNEGIKTTWIGPNCDISCYFGGEALDSNGTTYCKCDPFHYGPDCSSICPGVEEGLLCGGHGECNSLTGDCVCHSQWMGSPVCDSCSPGWLGSDCSVAISTLPNSTTIPGVCVSFGDPHMTTFSGTNYNMNTAGAYVLMRSPQTLVQVLQVRCTGTRPCIRNEEVTIQAGSVTVSAYAPTDGTNYPLVTTDMGNGVPTFLSYPDSFVFEGLHWINWYLNSRHKLTVTTPEGVVVTVACYYGILSVSVLAPPALKGQTSGLCGAFDGNVDDDFSWRPCFPGRKGEFCELLDCPGEPDCNNRGDCELDGMTLNLPPTCRCMPGFSGPACENIVCFGEPICGGPRGSCIQLTDGTPFCACSNMTTNSSDCSTCLPGFGGIACTIPLNCPGGPMCGGKGECIVVDEVAECQCQPPYDGPACEYCVSGFTGPQCLANLTCTPTCTHGWCIPDVGNPSLDTGVCFCRSNFTGPTCDTILCTSNNCNGNGDCVATPSGHTIKCLCSANFTGRFCDECIANHSGPSCDILTLENYTANATEYTLNMTVCNSHSCHGKGNCSDDNVTCICETNFTGPTCGECIANHSGPNCDNVTWNNTTNATQQPLVLNYDYLNQAWIDNNVATTFHLSSFDTRIKTVYSEGGDFMFIFNNSRVQFQLTQCHSYVDTLMPAGIWLSNPNRPTLNSTSTTLSPMTANITNVTETPYVEPIIPAYTFNGFSSDMNLFFIGPNGTAPEGTIVLLSFDSNAEATVQFTLLLVKGNLTVKWGKFSWSTNIVVNNAEWTYIAFSWMRDGGILSVYAQRFGGTLQREVVSNVLSGCEMLNFRAFSVAGGIDFDGSLHNFLAKYNPISGFVGSIDRLRLFTLCRTHQQILDGAFTDEEFPPPQGLLVELFFDSTRMTNTRQIIAVMHPFEPVNNSLFAKPNSTGIPFFPTCPLIVNLFNFPTSSPVNIVPTAPVVTVAQSQEVIFFVDGLKTQANFVCDQWFYHSDLTQCASLGAERTFYYKACVSDIAKYSDVQAHTPSVCMFALHCVQTGVAAEGLLADYCDSISSFASASTTGRNSFVWAFLITCLMLAFFLLVWWIIIRRYRMRKSQEIQRAKEDQQAEMYSDMDFVGQDASFENQMFGVSTSMPWHMQETAMSDMPGYMGTLGAPSYPLAEPPLPGAPINLNMGLFLGLPHNSEQDLGLTRLDDMSGGYLITEPIAAKGDESLPSSSSSGFNFSALRNSFLGGETGLKAAAKPSFEMDSYLDPAAIPQQTGADTSGFIPATVGAESLEGLGEFLAQHID